MILVKQNVGLLLRTLLQSIAHVKGKGAFIFGYDSLTVTASGFARHTVTLRLKSLAFAYFICTQPIKIWVNLDALTHILSDIGDEDSITLNIADELPYRLIVSFDDLPFGHGPVLMRRPPVLFPYDPVLPENYRDVNEAEFVYDVVVGIPSEEFGRIICETCLTLVDVIVADAEVTFRFGYKDIVLTTAGGGCIIGGMDFFDRVTIEILLSDCMESFIEASDHCTSVWLLWSQGDSPDMVYFSLRALGGIMFYQGG